MTYRARSTPPASDWGRFLVRMRQERDWSAVQAHEHLHEGLGLKAKSKASYTALEDGKLPSAAQERYLRAYFEGGPDERDRDPSTAETGERDGPVSAYLAEFTQAMTDHTRAMTALLDRFRETADRAEENSAAIRAMEAELRSLRAQLGAGAS